MTLTHGSPEVTAKITTLEELQDSPPNLFDVAASGGDSSLLKTVVLDEKELRKNLLPIDVPAWPPLKDGPLQGVLTTSVVVDRSGSVREIGTIVTDNIAIRDAATKTIGSMRFTPYLQNGVPVQVVSRITMPFKTTRPADIS